MIYHSKKLNFIFSKFVLSCLLRSHHQTNPTPKMAMPYLALPTRHPEKNGKIVIEIMKNE